MSDLDDVDVYWAGTGAGWVKRKPGETYEVPDIDGVPVLIAPASGEKFDTGKLEWDKFPWSAASGVLEVMHCGADKYQWNNWRKGLAWSRLFAATLRHLIAWLSKRGPDPEFGLSHLAHATCCLMFLLESEREGIGTDDRKNSTAP